MNVLAVNPLARVVTVPDTVPELPASPEATDLVNCVPLSMVTEPVKSPSGNCIDPEVPPEYPEPETDAVTDPDEPNPCEPMYLYTIEYDGAT